MMPPISVITISFDNLPDVIATCASVDIQSEKPFEHIIIDGSTKPDIKNWLESNAQPAYRKWVCERDKGIADAFNKGINTSTGTITTLLNSGDTLYDEKVLQKVTETFGNNPNAMWANGKLKTMRGGVWVIIGRPFLQKNLYRGMSGVFHPAMYVKRELYEQHGFFDLDIKMAMDYDFLCRISGTPNIFIDYPLAVFEPTGVSSVKYLDAMKESYASYRKYFGYSFRQIFWSWRLTFLYHLMNSRFGKWLYKMKVKMKMENR